jgi:predicted Zn finger-like uncharacterized protein
MRITCPNCNAQYEVGEDMIPSEGRDVQCSNCGTTWFQEGRARAASAVEDRAVRRPGRAVEEEADISPSDAVRRRAASRKSAPDQGTLDILREEREHEERLRAGDHRTDPEPTDDADALPEDAPDKNLPAPVEPVSDAQDTPAPDVDAQGDPDARTQAAAERGRMAAAATLARARGRDRERSGRAPQDDVVPDDDDDTDMSDVIAATMRDAATPATEDDDEDDDLHPVQPEVQVRTHVARRELLPDIEEINSSLRPDERAAEAEAEANGEAEAPILAKRSNGFRVGFLTVCALILVFVGVYVFADVIAEAAPQVASVLEAYVAWVDVQRVALAAAAETLTQSIAPDT